MKDRLCIVAILMIIFISTPCMAEERPFDHQLKTDTIVFNWSIDADNIRIQLSAKTKGWVGIGFNPTKKMKDANFILGYVKNNKVSITDHFGITSHQHKPDKKLGGKSNISNISGQEKGGITTISFTIPLNSEDETDRIISGQGKTTVLLAYGSGRDSFRSRHKFRTVLEVELTTGTFETIK
ncbi:DOMON domain-containing protein [Desulfocicer vacuolatum DSM 3385]|uniref:DOMON domain-containing protein n=1 Tax=Desulfocicer vacuolatum DSM 3385 TaxID=1121400 RepID=A0A1W2AGY9_9BACT|nr:DOMON domain-containing protein [Desulfocicer vacuolatum]SMC59936.1 DOMON domain-containing protein [Desulfocicer vacuolatum DSM 3385]